MKKYFPAVIMLLAAISAFFLSSSKHEKNESEYPSEMEFIQRTFPFFQYDPSAYSDALDKVKMMKNELKNKYLAKGTSVPQWQFAGPVNIGGRVVDIEFDPVNPNIIYAAAATGGVFKSTDKGKTWVPVFDDQAMLNIGDIAIDPVNTSTVYVGTGEANGGHNNFPGAGIYKSTDGGTTWTHLGLDSTASIGRIVINYQNPSEVYVAAVGSYFSPNPQRGIYKSQDGGMTWQKSLFVSDSTGAIDIVMNPTNPQWLMAAMWERVRRPNSAHLNGPSSGIYRSTNGGNSWTLLGNGNGLPSSANGNIGRIGLAISKSQPDVLFALFNDGSSYSGLYRTTDAGDSWVRRDTNMQIGNGSSNFSWYFGQVRIHPQNPDIVYAMDVGFMKSTNGGLDWAFNWQTHVDHHALAFDPSDPNFVINGNDGGINISTDAGVNWGDAAQLPITQFYEINIDYQNPSALYGGTQDNNTVRTTTGNLNDWDYLVGGDGFYVNVDPTNSNVIYAESQYGYMEKSTDGGQSWNYALSGINMNDPTNWSTPVVMSPFNNNVLYYGTNKIYRTTNGSASWTAISPVLTVYPAGSRLGTITTIAVSPLDSNIICAGTDDAQAWISTNNGSSWNKIIAGLPERWITRIVPDPHDANNIYISFSGLKWHDPQPHIYKTTNRGNTWTNISGNLPDAPVNAFIVDNEIPGRIYAGLDIGAFVSFNDGDSWDVLGSGLPVVSVYDFKIHPLTNQLIAGTHGRSMYRLNLNDLVDAAEEKNIPDNFSIEQNYPNPFNPSTSISYKLNKPGFVDLRIFDITGKEASVLINEYKNPGSYKVTFNAGSYFSSGVYFYRLTSGGNTITKKMVYLK